MIAKGAIYCHWEASRLPIDSMASWVPIRSLKQSLSLHVGYKRWCVGAGGGGRW